MFRKVDSQMYTYKEAECKYMCSEGEDRGGAQIYKTKKAVRGKEGEVGEEYKGIEKRRSPGER